MKIAILTQPLCTNHGGNYGGILQAYALQNILKQYGHNVITLNRLKGYPSIKELFYRIGSFFKCLIRIYIKGNHDYVLRNPFLKGDYIVNNIPLFNNDALAKFINDNISMSKTLYSTHAIKSYIKSNQIECCIVGSDQVWREIYSPNITNYFCDFLGSHKNIKRYAYAASFGTSQNPISKHKLEKCIKYLKLFDKVSVREKSGISYLEKVFHYNDAETVLDPTFLLSTNHYYSLIKKEDIFNSGIVSYILDENHEKDKIVSLFARKNKLQTKLSIHPFDENGKPSKYKSISEWLASIAGADLIVTDSFHGCVFSIIFKKRFIAIGNKSRGIDRFITLLENFKLTERLVFSQQECIDRMPLLLDTINYKEIDKTLDQLRIKSLEFIKDI